MAKSQSVESYPRRLLGLFVAYFKITAFTLGGGMVMLPLMEDEFIRKRGWLTTNDFIGVVTIINTLPGVIAFNSSLIIGRKVAGFGGSIAALLGAMLPSVLMIILLAPLIGLIRLYPIAGAAFTSVRAAVAALILLLLFRQAKRSSAGLRELIFAAGALFAVRLAGVHPILVIPAAAILGIPVFGKDEEGEQDDSC